MSLAKMGETDNDAIPDAPSCCCASERAYSIEPSGYFRFKGILDGILAALLLVPGIPIILCSVVLVRLTSKGPGIFSQTRVGKGRRVFTMYKIRTMRLNAEDGTGPVWTANKDDRITPVGRFLRRTHLDELPQLFNVLKGEMSLIGPRPERPEFVEVLAGEIPNYLDRIAVRPGVTGLAQINLDPDVDLESVRRKIVLDTEYIKNATVLLDMRMLLVTLLYLLGCRPEWAKRVTRLKREVPRFTTTSLAGVDVSALVTPAVPSTPILHVATDGGSKNGSRSGDYGSPLHEGVDANHGAKEATRRKPR